MEEDVYKCGTFLKGETVARWYDFTPWAGLRRRVGFSAGAGDGYRNSGARWTCRDRGGVCRSKKITLWGAVSTVIVVSRFIINNWIGIALGVLSLVGLWIVCWKMHRMARLTE